MLPLNEMCLQFVTKNIRIVDLPRYRKLLSSVGKWDYLDVYLMVGIVIVVVMLFDTMTQ